LAGGARDHVVFLGSVVQALAQAILRPRRMRWREIARVFEKAGVNALPVVSLVSALFGVNVAIEGAQPLAHFGAEIFTASVIGRASCARWALSLPPSCWPAEPDRRSPPSSER